MRAIETAQRPATVEPEAVKEHLDQAAEHHCKLAGIIVLCFSFASFRKFQETQFAEVSEYCNDTSSAELVIPSHTELIAESTC